MDCIAGERVSQGAHGPTHKTAATSGTVVTIKSFLFSSSIDSWLPFCSPLSAGHVSSKYL